MMAKRVTIAGLKAEIARLKAEAEAAAEKHDRELGLARHERAMARAAQDAAEKAAREESNALKDLLHTAEERIARMAGYFDALADRELKQMVPLDHDRALDGLRDPLAAEVHSPAGKYAFARSDVPERRWYHR